MFYITAILKSLNSKLIMRRMGFILIICFFGSVKLNAHCEGGESNNKNNGEKVNQKGSKSTENMILVEGGTFTMGSNEGETDSRPAHQVTISSFYIDKYEVTNAQFCEFLNSITKNSPDEVARYFYQDEDIVSYNAETSKYKPLGAYSKHPVVEVTWEGAVAYAEWVGKRLPTEAEWEFAARGGKNSTGFEYSGNNKPDLVAWYNDPYGSTRTIGTKMPNELGIYDMSGNVWEWCSDWYDKDFYKKSESSNPNSTVPDKDATRVLRGGAWNSTVADIKIIYRNSLKPHYSNGGSGFRCAMDAD